MKFIGSALLLLFACACSAAMASDDVSTLTEMYEARLARLERLLSGSDDSKDDSESSKKPPPPSVSTVKKSPPPTTIKASPPPPPYKQSDDSKSESEDKSGDSSNSKSDDKSSSSSSKYPPPAAGTSSKASPPPPPYKRSDDSKSDSQDKSDDSSKSDSEDKSDDSSKSDSEDKSDDSKSESEKESEGGGSKVKGDPHFTGADNSHFDFSGVPNNTYCLMSDSHLHVNAYFGGYYGEYEGNAHKALTWIRKVGVMWGHHTFLFEAREGAEWRYNNGYMARMEVDGDEVALSQAGDSAVFADGAAKLTWESAKLASGDDEVDVYALSIAGVAVIRMELRPEVANLRLPTDGTVHFDLQFEKARFSSNAHGILGQTYRPDHKDRLSKQKLVFSELLHTKVIPGDNAEGFLDGSESVYRSSHLLQADCQVSRFSRAMQLDSETSMAIEMSRGLKSGAVGSSGVPRKMLFKL